MLFFVANERASGVLQPLDGAGRWLCQISVPPEEWSLDVFTHERARAWIRAAVGVEGLEPEVLSLGLWKLNATVAERFVQGRVLLCGDAAHQFPPTGGLGVNTGLQGMHNAMWKLAWFVHGRAGWPLVETYETERRGVAQRITSQSLQNSINVPRSVPPPRRAREGALTAEQVVAESRRYGNHLGVEFGTVYQSSAVVADGTQPPDVADSYSDYVPSATPGARAPHVWLGHAEARLSTLDLFGSAFTLLAAPGGDAWCARGRGGRARARRPDRSLPHRGARARATSAASARPTGSARTAPCWSGPTGTSRGGAPPGRRALRRCATPSSASSRASESTPRGMAKRRCPAGIGL